MPISPNLAFGGWFGYNKNSDIDGDSASPTLRERDILNWAVTAAFPNLGGEGNLGDIDRSRTARYRSNWHGNR
jgi:hypothetical protein